MLAIQSRTRTIDSRPGFAAVCDNEHDHGAKQHPQHEAGVNQRTRLILALNLACHHRRDQDRQHHRKDDARQRRAVSSQWIIFVHRMIILRLWRT